MKSKFLNETCTHTQGKEKRERLKEKKFTYQNLLVSFSLSYVWVERTSLQFKKITVTYTHTVKGKEKRKYFHFRNWLILFPFRCMCG